MNGTAGNTVTRSCSIAASTASRSKRAAGRARRRSGSPPAGALPRPWAWNRATTARITSSSVTPTVAVELLGLGGQVGARADHALGRARRSRREREQRRRGRDRRRDGIERGAACYVAVELGAVGDPDVRAPCRRRPSPDSRSPAPTPGRRRSRRRRTGRRCWPSSASVNSGFSGTAIAPSSWVARNVVTKSWLLPSTRATPSPGLTPAGGQRPRPPPRVGGSSSHVRRRGPSTRASRVPKRSTVAASIAANATVRRSRRLAGRRRSW